MKKFSVATLILSCAVSCASLLTLSACAVGEAEVNYTLSEDGTHYILSGVTGDKRALTEYDIPATYADGEGQALPVTEIGDRAFFECYWLSKVTIPQGVTYIGNRAFGMCGLVECDIPDTVTTIGELAFGLCNSLKEVTVPSSVTSLGDRAFYCCSGLVTARIEADVEVLGDEVFYNSVATEGNNTFISTKLKTVYLSKSIKRINVSALYGNMITDIYYAGTEEEWTEVSFFAVVEREVPNGKEGEKEKVEETQNKSELLKSITMHFSAK